MLYVGGNAWPSKTPDNIADVRLTRSGCLPGVCHVSARCLPGVCRGRRPVELDSSPTWRNDSGSVASSVGAPAIDIPLFLMSLFLRYSVGLRLASLRVLVSRSSSWMVLLCGRSSQVGSLAWAAHLFNENAGVLR